MSLRDMIKERRVLVLIGAGGVGKTTTSVAVATLAAQSGKKVALLSIDPAKRLAAALGMSLGSTLSQVNFGREMPGSVHAAMLDQKAVFDAMVRRHSPSPAVEARILADPLYKAASTNLGGPLEYMALAKLHELASDPQWDLVVLDTPPDTHALDFLARPNLLSGFMDNKVLSWLVKPFLVAGKFGFGRIMSLSEKLMGGMATVTGVDALRNLGEFLILMQEVIEGFHKAGEGVIRLLRGSTTGFFLVTVPTKAAARSAVYLADQLFDMGYRLDALILNRCVPEEVVTAELPEGPWASLLSARRDGEAEVTQSLKQTLATHQGPAVMVKVPDQALDLHNADGIVEFANHLANARHV
jgi:anion-transporting  ArsA/GET3 family ATPase